MRIANTLYAKLTLAFLLLVTLLGGWLLFLSQSISERYSQEVMQRLNQSVAMYVTEQQQLIRDGQVDEVAVDELASRAMVLNPSLEIYILDVEGKIISHRLPEDAVKLSGVSLGPIDTYLSAGQHFPILGDDPREPANANAISVSPIIASGELQGYVYAIIGGRLYQQLRDSVKDSYVLRVGISLMVSSVLAAAVVGSILFFFLTRRLTHLRRKVHRFDPAKPERYALEFERSTPVPSQPRDEIDQLNDSFRKMATHIAQQFDALRSLDETRRELVANVSHDLRTPLASMQGYIETLLIKDESLDAQEKKQYLTVAYKHSQRLSRLIAELFELAKLESGGIEPKVEPFSLMELAHDCVQEFGLTAEKNQVRLDIQSSLNDIFVVADIALIHRVLQNLIENAFRHTPAGGRVAINISQTDSGALVKVSDTGNGIQTHEIPYIFDRFYQSQRHEPAEKIGTGLGLAIVKRILDLHKSRIDVDSQPERGTSFLFELPQYQA